MTQKTPDSATLVPPTEVPYTEPTRALNCLSPSTVRGFPVFYIDINLRCFIGSGSYVKFLGSTNIRNDSGILDPTWECLIDGVDIGTTDPFPFPENNWSLCEWKDGTPGQHTLTVRANSRGRTFWADRVEYVPSPNAIVPDGSVVSVRHTDYAIKLQSGWEPLGEDANVTRTQGATAEVEFVGEFLGSSSTVFGS